MKLVVDAELKGLNAFIKSFPELRMAYMSSIAKKGRSLMRNRLLSGQELNLKKGDRDKAGRYMVKGKVGRANTIVFSSYPTNLFERGRRLRDGKKEAGKRIIKVKFKGLLNGHLQSYSNSAYKSVIEKNIKAI